MTVFVMDSHCLQGLMLVTVTPTTFKIHEQSLLYIHYMNYIYT